MLLQPVDFLKQGHGKIMEAILDGYIRLLGKGT